MDNTKTESYCITVIVLDETTVAFRVNISNVLSDWQFGNQNDVAQAIEDCQLHQAWHNEIISSAGG